MRAAVAPDLITAKVVRNLFTNPSGENTGGWSSNNGATWTATWDTTVKRSGTQSRKWQQTAGVTAATIASCYGLGLSVSARLRVNGGATYTASLFMRAGQDGYKGRLVFTPYTAAAVSLGNQYGPYINLVAGQWVRVPMTFTVPPTAYDMYSGFDVVTANGTVASNADIVWTDDAMLTEGPDLYDFQSPVSTPGWRWTGTASASESVGHPYLLSSQAGTPMAWYEARSVLGVGLDLPADMTAVSKWADLSGNDNHLLQLTTARQPTFRSKDTVGVGGAGAVPYFDHPSWILASGHTLDSNRVLNCGSITTQTKFPKLAVPYGATNVVIRAEVQASGNSPSFGSPAPYIGSNYYAADGVTAVANTGGNTGNGYAVAVAGDGVTWTPVAASFSVGNNIRLMDVNFASYLNTPGVKFRNIWVQYLISGVWTPAARIEPTDLATGDQPVIRFDGVDDFLALPGSFSLGSKDITVYAVLRSDDDTGGTVLKGLYGQGSPTANTPGFEILYRLDLGRPASVHSRLSNGTVLHSIAFSDGTRDVASQWAIYTQQRSTASRAGIFQTVTAPTGSIDTASQFVVGARSVTGQNSSLSISALLIYDRDHDTSTRARVLSWLSSTYGS